MITILMATYNGAQFLAEQIDSLLRQTVQDFRIVIRDDCSTDETWTILQAYQARWPEKIRILKSESNSGSAKYNFMELALHYQDDYIMFCDQDDVWNDDKIAISLQAIQDAEVEYGKDTPLLAHTDLTVVNHDLEMIYPSLVYIAKIPVYREDYQAITIRNTVHGCTAIYNRALAEVLRNAPFCMMHDWWVALTAASFGRIVYCPEATIQYRQHGNNTFGAANARSILFDVSKVLRAKKGREILFLECKQANSFLEVYNKELSTEQRLFFSEFAALPQLDKFKRWQEFNRLKVIKSSWPRRLAQLFYI